MITGAIILLVGLLVGYLFGRVMSRAKVPSYKPPKEPKPNCGCGHHYALHDSNGICHQQVMRHDEYAEKSWYEQCPCQRYIGPEPLPLIITGPGGES